MTDQLITASLYKYVLAYPVYRNTKLLLKGNQTFSLILQKQNELVRKTLSVVI